MLRMSDLKFTSDDLKRVFGSIVKDEAILKVITLEYLNCLWDGMDRFEAFNKVVDKWIDGGYGDRVDGEIELVETDIDMAIDRMFEDDWRMLDAGMDYYVWGWDGGGWVNYE